MGKIEIRTIEDVELVLRSIVDIQTRFLETKIARQSEQNKLNDHFEPQLAEHIRVLAALHEELEEQVPALVSSGVLSRNTKLKNGSISLTNTCSLVCPADIVKRLKELYFEEALDIIKVTEEVNKHALRIWPLQKLKNLGVTFRRGTKVTVKTNIQDVAK